MIEETIYVEMYANQVKPKTESQVRQLVSKVSQRLHQWLVDSGINLEEVESMLDSPILEVELAFRFFSAQLLLIWPYKSHPDAVFRGGQEIARKCMKLLLRLWESSDQRNFAALPWLVHALFALLLVLTRKAI